MTTNTHELFFRTRNADGTNSLTRFAAYNYIESDAREDLIYFVENIAKDGKTLTNNRDAIVYKVNGVCEFFVSRYFYIWPNTDRGESNENGKNSGKGYHRQN